MKNKERILRHLEDYGNITTLEAIYEYGNTRLSEYIRQLRVDGYDIHSVWHRGINRYGEGTNYVKYVLYKESQSIDN